MSMNPNFRIIHNSYFTSDQISKGRKNNRKQCKKHERIRNYNITAMLFDMVLPHLYFTSIHCIMPIFYAAK